jgi:small redox-active disulfide protein 2
MKIEVCGPGCARCVTTERNVIEACAELDLAAEVSHVYEIKKFAQLGVKMTPAVIVDGKIMVSGKVPTVEELKKILGGVKK